MNGQSDLKIINLKKSKFSYISENVYQFYEIRAFAIEGFGPT